MLDTASVIVDLLLHLTLIFLQVSEPRLQKGVFLLLSSISGVVSIASQLEFGDDMGHIVLVDSFKNVSHLFNLTSVLL